MAKMFYTLDETAEQLGVSADQVKQLAAQGKLQQFRDRDKLMFKRDQVDALATPAASEPSADSTMGSGPIELNDSADTDALGLSASGPLDLADSASDSLADLTSESAAGTGLSVFDMDEVDTVDPMAQTEVGSLGEEAELSLESIGSGSGLLDLTHESDDTSLGAELLDEIMPSGTGVGESPDISASSGILEEITAEAGTGLDNLAATPMPGALNAMAEPYDPKGSAFSAGLLLGALAALVIALMVAVSGIVDVPLELTAKLTASDANILMAAGGLLGVSLLLGGIGWAIGKKLGG